MPHPFRVRVETDGADLMGCGGDPMQILGGDWAVTTLGGLPLPPGAEVTLGFTEERIGGRSGCNRYSAALDLAGEELRIGPAAATKMACAPERMQTEAAFFAALAAATSVTLARDGTLELTGGDSTLIRARR
jgi:heat shock protein HslJ